MREHDRDRARARSASGDDRQATPGKATRAGGNDLEVAVGKTKNAELKKVIPVGKDRGSAQDFIVLQLKPSDLPSLAPGDQLTTPCELELTTAADIGQGGYDPEAEVSIILGDKNDKRGPELGHKQLQLKRSAHHTTVVFGREAKIDKLTAKQIPKQPHVNVVLSAWHRQSDGKGRLDTVIVGSNEGDYLNDGGNTDHDQARLMTIRERGNVKAANDNGKDGQFVMQQNKHEYVVASHELDSVDEGDQFFVEAEIEAVANQRARFSTQLVLADKKGSKKHLDVSNPKPISESNGHNLQPGNQDKTKKVAVFEIKKRVKGPLFLNVVAVKAGAGAPTSPKVTVKKTTFKVDRYDKK